MVSAYEQEKFEDTVDWVEFVSGAELCPENHNFA